MSIDSRPYVAVTRTVPGELDIPGADVRVLGDALPTREALLEFVPGASVILSNYTDGIDAELLDVAGAQLRGVCNHAVGIDNIDLEACRERGVAVTNTPDSVTEGTANMAWMLALAAARRLIQADRYARSPEYPARGQLGMAEFLGRDLTGRTMVIVGAGRIGYAVALRARSLAMRVLYVSRSRHARFELAPIDGRWVSLEEGMREADVVSIHCPLTDQTRHLIDDEAIGFMKPTTIVVNTARGPIIDEDALERALREGRLFAAALDVHENEPVVHPGLAKLDNAILTPHIGSGEQRYRVMMTDMCTASARAILAGESPPHRVV